MKRALLLLSSLAVMVATPAFAQYGVNLGWSNCGTTSTTLNRTFACDDNAASFNLVGSFKLPAAMPNFVAINANVDFWFCGFPTPDWWQFASGGCREGSLALLNVGSVSSCSNPYAGTAGQGGGFVYVDAPPGGRKRLNLDWARAEATALSAGVRYTGFVAQINGALSWDEGDPANPVCSGCGQDALLMLAFIEVFPQSGLQVLLTNTEDRSFATWQSGSLGCLPDSPRRTTWGGIKATYR